MSSQDYLLQQLKEVLPYYQKSANNVSKRGIDWQIDHCLKVISSVGKAIIKSDPKEYKPKFNLVRFYIMSTGHIPRGKGRAPKAVNVKDEISLSDLEQQFTDAESIFQQSLL